jgi:hypothetical protein
MCDCNCNDPVNALADPASVDLLRTARRLTRGLLPFAAAAATAVRADLIIIVIVVLIVELELLCEFVP